MLLLPSAPDSTSCFSLSFKFQWHSAGQQRLEAFTPLVVVHASISCVLSLCRDTRRVRLRVPALDVEVLSEVVLRDEVETSVCVVYDGSHVLLFVDGSPCPRVAVQPEATRSGLPHVELGSAALRGLLHSVAWAWSVHTPDLPSFSAVPTSVAVPSRFTRPLHSIDALLAWSPATEWAHSSTVPLDRSRLAARSPDQPRLCVTHDMRGGYVEDADPQGHSLFDPAYNFVFWSHVDVFVYFSHARVTMPPPAWTDAAHTHGVLSLGTLIFEWEEGARDAVKLADPEQGSMIADKLVEMACFFGFDGWLVNVESSLPGRTERAGVVQFMSTLTQRMHEAFADKPCMTMWYDSLNADGKIHYACELNDDNADFFQASDAIFLDYHWTAERPGKSAAKACELGRSSSDVFVGVDVFGRGSYGGGKFDSVAALKVAFDQALTSVALFAQAWTYEVASGGRRALFERCEAQLWNGYVFREIPLTWKVESEGGQGFRRDDDGTLVCSHDWCVRESRVPIRSLDGALYVSQAYKGEGPNFADEFYFHADVLDEAGLRLARFDSGIVTASAEWRTVEFEIPAAARPPEARTLRLEVGGKDAEHWAGHFGTRIGRTSLFVSEASRHGVADIVPPRTLQLQLPFVQRFDTGCGPCMFVCGERVSSLPWLNLGMQSLVCEPISRSLVHAAGSGCTLRHDDAFLGATSLRLSSGRFVLHRFCAGAGDPVSQTVLVNAAVKGEGDLCVQLTDEAGSPFAFVEVEPEPADEHGWVQRWWAVVVPSLAAVRTLSVEVDCPASILLGSVRLLGASQRLASAEDRAAWTERVVGRPCLTSRWSVDGVAARKALANAVLTWDSHDECCWAEVRCNGVWLGRTRRARYCLWNVPVGAQVELRPWSQAGEHGDWVVAGIVNS